MDAGLLGQYIFNALMQGMMYALVAVGFTLFFGVLNVIQFSHGDVLMVASFVAYSTIMGVTAVGIENPYINLAFALITAVTLVGLLGAVVARLFVLPLRSSPPLNTLLLTLMLGTVLRESVRLFFPNGSHPKLFPALLPTDSIAIGSFDLRLDTLVLLVAGLFVIVAIHLVINRTRLGLAIRAVAQDEETAMTMGINFRFVVLMTFVIGSAVAAFAGVMNGLYYNEINFNSGLLLGVIGFAAAIVGGLGNIYGAIVGGFLFAILQTVGEVAMPFDGAYKDVFAFAVVIALMTWRPTGLIAERVSERV